MSGKIKEHVLPLFQIFETLILKPNFNFLCPKISFKDICSSIRNRVGYPFLTELMDWFCLGSSACGLLGREEFGGCLATHHLVQTHLSLPERKEGKPGKVSERQSL
ncbi:unnamed protein product [Pipistrellus nathusii]|uniref:Uncharacterized protein n=1 Tax=Pipistrellus nathusii TaxID=59473 RepID=A0ABN9Z6J8_PIPNA